MIVLVLGGTRSGKSEIAERLASRKREPVRVVAPLLATDPVFAARVAEHRDRRPASWETIEAPADLPSTLAALTGTVVVDSLGAWVAALDCAPDVDALCAAIGARAGLTVLVSEEVGLGVHPPTEVGLRFADALGECNRRVAAIADRVLLAVAGRVLELPEDEIGDA